MQPRVVLMHPGRCLGCRSCELACSLSHSGRPTLVEALDTPSPSRIRLRRLGAAWAPLACRHCTDAPCVHACIAGARLRGDSGIRTDGGLCVGCGSCYMVCPMGAVTRCAATGRYASCDRCGDSQQTPSCVRACPTRALELAEPGEAERVAGADIFFVVLESDREVAP